MKKFVIPEAEVVHFVKKDVIATSGPCTCVSCTVCPEGKNDCACYDFGGVYNPTNT